MFLMSLNVNCFILKKLAHLAENCSFNVDHLLSNKKHIGALTSTLGKLISKFIKHACGNLPDRGGFRADRRGRACRFRSRKKLL